MKKKYKLYPKGYFRDEARKFFPEKPGIYFVYSGVFSNTLRIATLRNLLYIGETDNLYSRFNEHDRRNDFLGQLDEGESLFYTLAVTSDSDLERKQIEAALIYELNPLLNKKSIDSFNYDETIIEIYGDRHAYVPAHIEAPSY